MLKKVGRDLKNSLQKMSDNIGRCVLIATVDVFFIILVSGAFSFFFRKIADSLAKLFAFAVAATGENPEIASQLKDITSVQDLINMWNNIFLKFAILYFGAVLLWSVTQGVSWHISKAIEGFEQNKIIGLKKYVARFTGISFLAFSIIFIIGYFTTRLSFASGLYAAIVAAGFTMSMAQQIILATGIILIALILALLPIIYSNIFRNKIFVSIGKSMKELFSKKIFSYLFIFIGFGVAFFLSQKIQSGLALVNWTLVVLFGLIVDIGLLILFRMTFIKKNSKKIE